MAAQSPDMSFIKAKWVYLETEKNKRSPTNLTELWNVLQDIWHNFPGRVLQLAGRMNKRVPILNNKAKGKVFTDIFFFFFQLLPLGVATADHPL